MAAPKGNIFYKLRDKDGRDRIFATPEALYNSAVEYFNWCIKHPLYSVDYKGGKRVKIPTARPYSMKALCNYLGINESYFNQFKRSIEEKSSPESEKHEQKSEDFSLVISYIEQIVYVQKFEGAVVGAYNANIISRELGLVDKQQVAHEFYDVKLNL